MKSTDNYDLFNPVPDYASNPLVQKGTQNDCAQTTIPGLIYLDNFIDSAKEQELIREINLQPWLTDIKRRVQHYGWRYDYKARGIDYSMFLGKLPLWAEEIAKKLVAYNLIKDEPDQVIVNEYLPGQGIAGHVDCAPCFGDTIVSLSLASNCTMDFINLKTKEKIENVLKQRSVAAISGEARYDWTHGIAARLADQIDGKRINRELRISLTFRKVML
ncbi:alpha-ketoglutarate-dependent dioxygenase AlkB [Mucilaginibacter galii]|uniref:Alpha-ketoglutarate-dependent dioxygenase AlkB n=1 Tax=Mucilaginibacter galii TaxID=2005073 RepID=A0A917N134_9SPHI|nr:alpha-ketoglutarate-dependent dioxygenase AlkB [Mucilaginibacter galii]GGI50448.1 alpha-ketoglutarate-dependent dioxygenase AlkB [Mucilaginibacter galii]